MKKFLTSSALALAFIGGLAGAAHAAAAKYDWTTDGGDNARSGWNKQETTLTKTNIKNLKLRWSVQTDNAARSLHNLMPALVVGNLQTPQGAKEVTIVTGVSDNLYAFDSETGALLWRRSWGYAAGGGGRGGAPGGAAAGAAPAAPPPAPTISNTPNYGGFLQPGGSTDVPVIGPADAQGRRPLYFVTGDGVLNTINAATGEDIAAPFYFQNGKNWGLSLVVDAQGQQWIYDQSIYSNSSIAVTRIGDPTHTVLTLPGFGGGAWGRRGLAIDSKNRIFATTGDGGGGNGPYTNPNHANSVISAEVVDGQLKLRDWYTATNWVFLWKRDLDPNNTPTIFDYKGREIVAASGKECRVTLLDAENMGGGVEDHSKPIAKSPLVCNDESDFQDHGSWGALSSWEDSAGVRWVIIPFWGASSKTIKFPIVNQPVTKLGGVAALKVTGPASAPVLSPAWVSRDMNHGEPAIIANGMIFTYGSGENTRQTWPDTGSLTMQSARRATENVTHATIYILDAQTGKELWNSGDTIKSWNHFSGITVANGKVYLGTYDGKFYCFSL